MYKHAVDAHMNRPLAPLARALILSSPGQAASKNPSFVRSSSKRCCTNCETSLLVADSILRGYGRTPGWDPSARSMSDSCRLTTMMRMKEGRSDKPLDRACIKTLRSPSLPHSSKPSMTRIIGPPDHSADLRALADSKFVN